MTNEAETSIGNIGKLEKTILYMKPGCPYCARAKEDMTNKGVEFEEVDVTEHADRAAEVVSLVGHRSVPVIVKGDEVQLGYGGY